MRRLYFILTILMLGMASCTDNIFNDNDEITFEEGEAVRFITNVPSMTNSTRSYSLNEDVIKSYSTVQDEYAISVEMYEQGNDYYPIGTCTYKPVVTMTGYDEDGTLEAAPAAEEKELYWITNKKAYAFKASAGTEELESDQSSKIQWLAQDKLEGYGFTPLKNEDEDVDDINALNYHTNREWGALNREWRTLDNANNMLSTEHYKYIPLFMQHQRSWITLKLKAGNGVSRESLKFEAAQKNGIVTFFSYKDDAAEPFVVEKSWAQPDTVDYKLKDKNGDPQDGVETTSYNVIVEPHNYYAKAEDHKIANISLSGLKFTFSAKNDYNYEKSTHTEMAGYEEALKAMNAYNLGPGKHLTITATLTTDRIVFITAWIEDWTTVATTTICDDYGQNGDPILINSRQDLIDFLKSDSQNKSGNVAIVVANSLDLDKQIITEKYTKEEAEAYNKAHKNDPGFKAVKEGDIKNTTTSNDSWSNYNNLTLNATLNLAGARLNTSSRFLESVSSSGSIINGTVVIGAPVESAIAKTNMGTLERINITAGDGGKASRAGMVITNRGTIYQCTSAIHVYGENSDDTKTLYIGGIAAESCAEDNTTMPVIDGCTVLASVKGNGNVKGGGIVGLADGRITNNVFEYGITILQDPFDFKNIISEKTQQQLRAHNNSWPTIAPNQFEGTDNDNANISAQYDNVLDCQKELEALLLPTHNISNKKYRLSKSFTVMSQDWKHGIKHDNTNYNEGHCNGNLYCELDGNDMTITLDGTETVQVPANIDSNGKATSYESDKITCAMLFSNITGSVHDLTLYLAQPLIAKPATNSSGVLEATDAIAPLAYAVTGPNASVKNVKVKMENTSYIQAALPAGIVCWAYNGATVERCQVKGVIRSWIPTTGNIADEEGGATADARRYAGGIVGIAARATISQCVFHTEKNTLEPAKSQTAQIFYGGILGGTTTKTINNVKENPEVSIVDCTSWFSPEENSPNKGAILGYAIYYDANNKPIDGTVNCQGNWWNTTYKGVAKVRDGQTIEDIIGSCNNYTPIKDNDF